jgi:hypothetical protein
MAGRVPVPTAGMVPSAVAGVVLVAIRREEGWRSAAGKGGWA